MRAFRMLNAVLVLALLVGGCSPVGSAPPGAPAAPAPAPGPAGPPAPADPEPPAGEPAVWVDAGQSPFAIRGVIEGFFGTPWSHPKRLAMLDFMARVGMNTYVYAPKDDPYQRSRWRDLYPEAELERLRELADRAAGHGIRFVYSISPGLDATYSSAADRAALAAKIDQVHGLGVSTIMLSLDDVPERLTPADQAVYGNNYAAAQADLANWLHGTVREQDQQFRLWMTPGHYWGTRPDAYLTTLGERLDPAVQLTWTGPAVLSETITARDADAFAAVVGRKPIIWDNYPVNDYTYVQWKRPRLLLGPLRGRAADLADHVAGYLLNPMIQAEASQLPLYTAAAYLAQPAAYDRDRAWQDAARRLAGGADGAAVLLEFAGYSRLSVLYDREAPALEQAIADYWDEVLLAPDRLRRQLEAMAGMGARLEPAVPAGFYAEVSPWVAALEAKGRAGLLALEADAAVRRQDAAAARATLPELRQALAALQTGDARAYIAARHVEQLVTRVIDRIESLQR